MQAAVVHEPGGPDVLKIEELPVPQVRPGWVLVRVRAFGLNRSELMTRAGDSGDAVRFPRVLGIECVGEVAASDDPALPPGQTVLAAMGGMGRDFDGGYEEYALLPAASVIPVKTRLGWAELGAIPETFGTAWGSLETLNLHEGQTLLVRGGTSSVGMAAITLAKGRGVTVIATTRQAKKGAALEANGADHVIIDDGAIASSARAIVPGGIDALLELVGPKTMLDSFATLRPGARACLTGYLEHVWDDPKLASTASQLGIELEQFGSNVLVRSAYAGVFQTIVDGIESGVYRVNLDKTFPLVEIVAAHEYMQVNLATGKVVGLTA
jgi:NADPH:quinone reductase-like Zn-dependent oxidoreductase